MKEEKDSTQPKKKRGRKRKVKPENEKSDSEGENNQPKQKRRKRRKKKVNAYDRLHNHRFDKMAFILGVSIKIARRPHGRFVANFGVFIQI